MIKNASSLFVVSFLQEDFGEFCCVKSEPFYKVISMGFEKGTKFITGGFWLIMSAIISPTLTQFHFLFQRILIRDRFSFFNVTLQNSEECVFMLNSC